MGLSVKYTRITWVDIKYQSMVAISFKMEFGMTMNVCLNAKNLQEIFSLLFFYPLPFSD